MNTNHVPLLLSWTRSLLIYFGAHYYIPTLRKFAPREKMLQTCGHCHRLFLTLDVKEHFRSCPVLNAQLLLDIKLSPRMYRPFTQTARINYGTELQNAS